MDKNVKNILRIVLLVTFPLKGTLYFKFTVVLEGLPCFVCDEKKDIATMLLYSVCQRGWHVSYDMLYSTLDFFALGDWICLGVEDPWNILHLRKRVDGIHETNLTIILVIIIQVD